jgi:hypothetical protein
LENEKELLKGGQMHGFKLIRQLRVYHLPPDKTQYQRTELTKSQLGGHGGNGASAEIAVTRARLTPTSNKSFLIMI